MHSDSCPFCSGVRLITQTACTVARAESQAAATTRPSSWPKQLWQVNTEVSISKKNAWEPHLASDLVHTGTILAGKNHTDVHQIMVEQT